MTEFGQIVDVVDTGWNADALICTFAVSHADGFMLFETGPQKTIEQLAARLDSRGMLASLTHILVTHIHLDHSGGAGWLQRQTNAEIVVHHAGARHLQQPERLIRSSRMVFGDAGFDALWEAPEPATGAVTSVSDGDILDIGGVAVHCIETTGHASHHMAFHLPESATLVTGDAAGARFGPAEGIRLPTVAPEYRPSEWLGSIKRMQDIPGGQVRQLAVTHGGLFGDPEQHLGCAHANLSSIVNGLADTPDNELPAALRDLNTSRIANHPDFDELDQKYEMINASFGCAHGIIHQRHRDQGAA